MQPQDHVRGEAAAFGPDQSDCAGSAADYETLHEFGSTAGDFQTTRWLLRHERGELFLRTVIRLRSNGGVVFDSLIPVAEEDLEAIT